MSKPDTKVEPSEDEIASDLFTDKSAMFGTSPVKHKLSDQELEYLTEHTAPRVHLTHSRRKIWLYSALFVYLMFFLRLVYHRAIPVTHMSVPDVYGLGETGLTVGCALIGFLNIFLAPRTDRGTSAWWIMLTVGCFIPLGLLAALYLMPAETVVKVFSFLF